jgi:hypothetical protein
VVAQLQQTSKQLQAAVANILQGQLAVVLCTVWRQQLQEFEQWLTKHGALVKGLTLQTDPSNGEDRSEVDSRCLGAAVFLGVAMQRTLPVSLLAAAAGSLPLQSLMLRCTAASPNLLQQLPTEHLTQLQAEVDLSCSDSMQAVAALSRLKHLTLEGEAYNLRHVAAEADEALAVLAAGLQQLTQLQIKSVRPVQLQHLPRKLQQLHVVIDLQQPQ